MKENSLSIIEKIKKRKEDVVNQPRRERSRKIYYPKSIEYNKEKKPLSTKLIKQNRRYRGPIESEKENDFQDQVFNETEFCQSKIDELTDEFCKINKSLYTNVDDMRYIKKIPDGARRLILLEKKLESLSERMNEIEKSANY